MPKSILSETIKEFEEKFRFERRTDPEGLKYKTDSLFSQLKAYKETKDFIRSFQENLIKEMIKKLEGIEFNPWENRNGTILISEGEARKAILDAIKELQG